MLETILRASESVSAAVSMTLAPDERSLFVLARQPRALVSVDLDRFQPDWSLALPEEPVEMALSPDGSRIAFVKTAGWLQPPS